MALPWFLLEMWIDKWEHRSWVIHLIHQNKRLRGFDNGFDPSVFDFGV
jgi:hypothetical protein